MDILDKKNFVFGSIFLLANKLQVLGDSHLAEDDMTIKQWFLTSAILQFVGESPTLTEVANLMGNSHQNVKQLALKLQEKGFLVLEKDKKDGRVLRLTITEKNHVFWKDREDRDQTFIDQLFRDLSCDEINAIYTGFNNMLANIHRMNNN